MTSKIAVIGTGNMGAPMSINLARAGNDVSVFDIVESRMRPLEAHGIHAASSHKEAIEDADLILTMLPTAVEVGEVYRNQVLPFATKQSLLVDSSTIDLKDAQDFHQLTQKNGFAMLDAPVSGGTAGAAAGTLTFMVGGNDSVLQRAQPILKSMGSKIIHCGEAGMGQAAKMCNNLMLGIQMASLVEGFHLAKRVGLSDDTLYQVASGSSANCFSLHAFCPVPGVAEICPANNDFKPGFSTDLMLKDMGIALNAAEQSSLDLDLAPVAASIYRRFSEMGHGGLDFSAIYQLLEDQR